jgi:FAD/FMN-containing dehydrogenase
MPNDLAPPGIGGLRATFRGQIILPGDGEYEARRQVKNLVHDVRPSLVVSPVDADDVAVAVRFAAKTGLEIAVRGGGHSNAGFGTVDGGIVIDLSSMRAVRIDPISRVGYAQGGVTAGEYTAASFPRGLVTPFGDSPGVGIGGLTLGGGTGWLTRKLGMTIDSLLAADVVTGDGRRLRASATEHPDLFWAIRGGGGNFGIVTSFEFKLHPIDTVLGGVLYLPPTLEVIRGVLALARSAPDELSIIALLMRIMFAAPGLPEKLHGQLSMMVMPVWSGDLAAGEQVLAPFRALAVPMADTVRPMPFTAMYEMTAPAGAGATSATRAMMADVLDDAAIEALLSRMRHPLPSPSSIAVIQFRVFGGAMSRVPSPDTAFAQRDAMLLVAIAILGFEPSDLAANEEWAAAAFGDLRHLSRGAYLNFLEAEGDTRIREAYPSSTYERLAWVKSEYDPHNLFHLNQNIHPRG